MMHKREKSVTTIYYTIILIYFHYCPTKININPAVTPFAIGLQPKNSMFQFQG